MITNNIITMNIIRNLSGIIQKLPNYITNSNVSSNPNISSIVDLTKLLNSTDFNFESKIQVCLYKISITNGPFNRPHGYRQIDEIFLPQYNLCLNAQDESNIFVSSDRYDDSKPSSYYETWKPSQLQSTKIIDMNKESEFELHQIICNLIKSYVEFNTYKSKISQIIDVINTNTNTYTKENQI